MKGTYLMSVSGGRTSMMLSKLLIDRYKLKPVKYYQPRSVEWPDRYSYTVYENEDGNLKIVFIFSNTGREKEETLIAMNNMKIHWNIDVVWVEAVVDHRPNKGTKHKFVNFKTACRNGDVFEDVIKKYGIPNNVFIHCTRELKNAPIRSAMADLGFGDWKTDYKTIIGYRADEPKRANLVKAEKLNQWYPLWEWGIKKADVAYFWNRQPFDLGLVDADGNCKKCYKKADLKVIYQIKTDPTDEWISEIQRKYSWFTPDSRSEQSQPPYYMFRGNRSLEDVIEQYPELTNKTA